MHVFLKKSLSKSSVHYHSFHYNHKNTKLYKCKVRVGLINSVAQNSCQISLQYRSRNKKSNNFVKSNFRCLSWLAELLQFLLNIDVVFSSNFLTDRKKFFETHFCFPYRELHSTSDCISKQFLH